MEILSRFFKFFLQCGILISGLIFPVLSFAQFFDIESQTTQVLDLSAQKQLAQQTQKQGILIFFEMEHCRFCQQMRQTVFAQTQLQQFFRQRFRTVAFNFSLDFPLKDFKQQSLTPLDFIMQQRIKVSPTLVFLDSEGNELYRFIGVSTDEQELRWLAEYVLSDKLDTMDFATFKTLQR